MNNDRLDLKQLKTWALVGLSQNIQETQNGFFLSAGATHFRSLWTRDFVWSIPGLLAAGRADVVQNHLEALLRFAHKDSALIPRVLETIPSSMRVAYGVMTRSLPKSLRKLPFKGPLFAEYRGEHKTISIDSNVLTTLGCTLYFDYLQKQPNADRSWWSAHKTDIERVFSFYKSYIIDGLVIQGEYEDWQDSVKRSGNTFYLNVLVSSVARKLRAIDPQMELSWIDTTAMDAKIQAAFWDSEHKLYRSWKEHIPISVDGNLLAIDLDWLTGDKAQELYQNLKKHPLWTRGKIPGLCSVPNYLDNEKSLTTKIVGLKHYHDQIVWSWLSALSSKVAWKVGDHAEAQRILNEMQESAIRDRGIAEVYTLDYRIYKTALYSSEFPFSWGSAKTLEAAAFIEAN